MKKFIISEEEKSRILGMHQEATKRQYLSEQQGTKTADPNTAVYNTPTYGFLTQTNLPQFLAKNNINLQALIKAGARLNSDKGYLVWTPQGSNRQLSLPIFTGGSKYLDNYSGYKDKYSAAFNKVRDEFNRIKNDESLKGYRCIKDNNFYPSNPVHSIKNSPNDNFYCRQAADKLDKLFKETKLEQLSNLAQIETFIENAPKFTT